MIRQSWLIQRLLKPIEGWEKNPFNFGGGYKNGGLSDNAMNLIKGIFAFDYMGAAEFEWGAVPEALNAIAKSAENHTLIRDSFKPFLARKTLAKKSSGKTKEYTKTTYYICNKDLEEYVKSLIKSLLAPKYKDRPRLKEPTLFDIVMEEREYCQKYCGWLELDNGFFFFTDEKMFEDTCKLFGIK